MIDKIIHISDLHVRPNSRYIEYETVMKKTINTIVQIASISRICIVITGDLLHTKTLLSPECITLLRWFLKELSKIGKTIIIAGNHDANLRNKDKLDGLSKKFIELKSLAIKYKDVKEVEIKNLNKEIDVIKKNIDEANSMYENMLDRTTESLEKIIKNAETSSNIQ